MSELHTATLPFYANRGGDQSMIQPGFLKDTEYFVFILESDHKSLQWMCDTYFNRLIGQQVYKPVGNFVVVMFTHVSKLSSADPDMGWLNYHDIVLWVPMVAHGLKGHGPRYVMYPAFMFVDNPMAMVTGRETFGYPKTMGTFTMDDAKPEKMTPLVAYVTGKDPQTGEHISQKLWEIIPSQRNGTPEHRFISDAAEMIKTFGSLVFKHPRLALSMDYAGLLAMFTGVSGLGLKQFRDAADGDCACYQAIVESPLNISKFHKGCVLAQDFVFKLYDIWTYPVHGNTGLKIGEQPVLAAFWYIADMETPSGSVVWQSSASNGGH